MIYEIHNSALLSSRSVYPFRSWPDPDNFARVDAARSGNGAGCDGRRTKFGSVG